MSARYVSRTAIETDWKCPHSRYLLTEHGGRGIVPVKVAEELTFGTAIHDMTQGLAPNLIDFSEELQALGAGLMWGFRLLVRPQLETRYEILHIEQELSLELTPDLFFLCQPDLLVRDKVTGAYGYIEYKSTKWANVGWITSWEKQPQLHAGLWAASQATGLPFEFAIVQGFHKSTPNKRTGRLQSPLVWAYNVSGGQQYSTEWKRDWDHFPVWTYDGEYGQGMEGWVHYLLDKEPETLAGCFPVTPPIYVDDRLVDTFLRQATIREQDIVLFGPDANVDQKARDEFFPQHFTSCQHGPYRCAYYEACHLIGGRDPLDTDLYVPRVPHHKVEAFALELEEEVF